MKVCVSKHAIEKYLIRIDPSCCPELAATRIADSLGVVNRKVFFGSNQVKIHRSGVTYVVRPIGLLLEVITCYADEKAKTLPGHKDKTPVRANIKSRSASRQYRRRRNEML